MNGAKSFVSYFVVVHICRMVDCTKPVVYRDVNIHLQEVIITFCYGVFILLLIEICKLLATPKYDIQKIFHIHCVDSCLQTFVTL